MKKPVLVGSPIILGLIVGATGLGGCSAPDPHEQVAVVGPKPAGKVKPRAWGVTATGEICWYPDGSSYPPEEGGTSGGSDEDWGDWEGGEGGEGASGGSGTQFDTYAEPIVGSGIYDIGSSEPCFPVIDDPSGSGPSGGGQYV